MGMRHTNPDREASQAPNLEDGAVGGVVDFPFIDDGTMDAPALRDHAPEKRHARPRIGLLAWLSGAALVVGGVATLLLPGRIADPSAPSELHAAAAFEDALRHDLPLEDDIVLRMSQAELLQHVGDREGAREAYTWVAQNAPSGPWRRQAQREVRSSRLR